MYIYMYMHAEEISWIPKNNKNVHKCTYMYIQYIPRHTEHTKMLYIHIHIHEHTLYTYANTYTCTQCSSTQTYMYEHVHMHTHTLLLTLLKWLSESGLTRHISVTRQTPVNSTPWFFSLSSCLMVGTYTSIRSGTLRTIRTAHNAAYKVCGTVAHVQWHT